MGYLDKYKGEKQISKSEFESKKSKGQISKTPSSVKKTASGATYTYPKKQMKESMNEGMQEGVQEYTNQRLMNKLEKKPKEVHMAKLETRYTEYPNKKMGKNTAKKWGSAFGKAGANAVSGKASEGAGKASAPSQVIRHKMKKSSTFVPRKKGDTKD